MTLAPFSTIGLDLEEAELLHCVLDVGVASPWMLVALAALLAALPAALTGAFVGALAAGLAGALLAAGLAGCATSFSPHPSSATGSRGPWL
jgi:hypothetical protein